MAVVDARPIIAEGGEPFETIMTAVTALDEHEELVVLRPSSRSRWRGCSPRKGSATRRPTSATETGRSPSGEER